MVKKTLFNESFYVWILGFGYFKNMNNFVHFDCNFILLDLILLLKSESQETLLKKLSVNPC